RPLQYPLSSLILFFFIYFCFFLFFFFFFSSRRRHTRSKRDWSSDVCSSDLVSRPDHGRGLEYQHHQGGIPPAPSCILAYTLLWLPPILYGGCQDSISGYSKAPRGLSVLSRVTCIFTGNMISPSLSLRQCPNRCAFRAGQNLPDKEFRYL